MILDLIKATAQWSVLAVAQIVLVVLGLIVIPTGLLFTRKESRTKRHKFSLGKNYWFPVHIAKWLWPWDNEEDGFRGDHEGRYWNRDAPKFCKSPLSKYMWWGAIRNPANNFKRFVLGLDVRDYRMVKLAGQDYVRDDFDNTGWQFLKAVNKGKGLNRFSFYWVYRYGKSNRALVVQLGNKIKLSHNDVVEIDECDYFKGFTTEINPFKDIS